MDRILVLACGIFHGAYVAQFISRATAVYEQYKLDKMDLYLPSYGTLPWSDGAGHPLYHASGYVQFRNTIKPLMVQNDASIVFFTPTSPLQIRRFQVVCDLAFALKKPIYPQTILSKKQ